MVNRVGQGTLAMDAGGIAGPVVGGPLLGAAGRPL